MKLDENDFSSASNILQLSSRRQHELPAGEAEKEAKGAPDRGHNGIKVKELVLLVDHDRRQGVEDEDGAKVSRVPGGVLPEACLVPGGPALLGAARDCGLILQAVDRVELLCGAGHVGLSQARLEVIQNDARLGNAADCKVTPACDTLCRSPLVL